MNMSGEITPKAGDGASIFLSGAGRVAGSLLPGYFSGNPVAETSKSAASWVSQSANAAPWRHPADLEIGDTAGLETCATPGLASCANATM
jgi:hypothetical protein